MDLQRVNHLLTVYRDGLLEDVLPFWIRHGVDKQHGGFTTALDRQGNVIDTDKSVWQQGRFTWLLGELYNEVQGREEWLELAKHGVDFIDRCCTDPSDNRMWFHVTQEGRPIRKRRYAFGESFAAIAYGELAKATGEARYADAARDAFHRFINHNVHPRNTVPKYTDTRPTRGLGFPMIAIVTAQQLRDSIDLEDASEWIDRSISTIVDYHMKPARECVMETVGASGEILDHFEGRTLNPGHAVEGAWFIMVEGWQRADHDMMQIGLNMLDWMWQRGWDEQYGGMLYFVDVFGHPVQEYWHDMKFWWPQNETIIATLLAYVLTGNEKYADWHRMIHEWTYDHFPDEQFGEWYGYLHRDGTLSVSLKGNLWKGPFHIPRMQLTCWQLLEQFKQAGMQPLASK